MSNTIESNLFVCWWVELNYENLLPHQQKHETFLLPDHKLQKFYPAKRAFSVWKQIFYFQNVFLGQELLNEQIKDKLQKFYFYPLEKLFLVWGKENEQSLIEFDTILEHFLGYVRMNEPN